MNLYLTINSIPELAGLDEATKQAKFREMGIEGKKRFGMKQVFIRLILIATVLLLPIIIINPTNMSDLQPVGGLYGAIGLIYFGMAVAYFVFIRAPMIEKGREYLREQGLSKS